ncbi:MAG: hypothetical protein JXQ99_16310 [Hyphomicrobiaceae bacterium]
MAKKPRTSTKKTPSRDVKFVKKRYEAFLTRNPTSKVGLAKTPSGEQMAIQTPWDDASLVLSIPEDDSSLKEALEHVLLPPRFTALWHADQKALEVIWTAFRPSTVSRDLVGRMFQFIFEGQKFECKFGPASDRLMHIAKASRPVAPSETNHRNLSSFSMYSHEREMKDEDPDHEFSPVLGEPTCFWISPVKWDDDFMLSLAQHLNFYMRAYDSFSPAIVIHSPATANPKLKPQSRYLTGSFPDSITSSSIDDTLLHFWDAAQEGDSARRFIYYYRILEYASFTFLEQATRTQVRRLLASPHGLNTTNQLSDQIVAAVQASKVDEYQRFEALVRETLDPELLWVQIQRNTSVFCEETTFAGGFTIAPLISTNTELSDFCGNGITIFCSTIRKVRNALSHGRDQRTAAVISPTTANFEKLRQWLPLMSVAAGQAMLYRHAL